MLITENKISRTLKIFQKIPWPDCNDFLVERDQNALSLQFPFGGLRRPRPIPSSHRSRSPPLPQEILYKKFAIRDREIPEFSIIRQRASQWLSLSQRGCFRQLGPECSSPNVVGRRIPPLVYFSPDTACELTKVFDRLKFVALWGVLTLTFAFPAFAAPEETITIATLLKGGWQIVGYTGTSDGRSAFILFRHPDEPYLVQCRASYDVTRTPSVTLNCYKLQ